MKKSVREQSVRCAVRKLDETYEDYYFSVKCIRHLMKQYLEKMVVVSHTEKGRKICEKVRITLDPEVIKEYFNMGDYSCKDAFPEELRPTPPGKGYEGVKDAIPYSPFSVLFGKRDQFNIGLIIETKIPDLDEFKKEMLENEEERQFHLTFKRRHDAFHIVDRRHLKNILAEQKLSSSGITDSETVKLGKILNLDIIVLRIIYEESSMTKVLSVETGEVLLFKTYSNETTKTDSE